MVFSVGVVDFDFDIVVVVVLVVLVVVVVDFDVDLRAFHKSSQQCNCFFALEFSCRVMMT